MLPGSQRRRCAHSLVWLPALSAQWSAASPTHPPTSPPSAGSFRAVPPLRHLPANDSPRHPTWGTSSKCRGTLPASPCYFSLPFKSIILYIKLHLLNLLCGVSLLTGSTLIQHWHLECSRRQTHKSWDLGLVLSCLWSSGLSSWLVGSRMENSTAAVAPQSSSRLGL